MSKKDKQLFYEDLIESITELYNVSHEIAHKAILLSDMETIIKRIGIFVCHDPIEVWAESVWACYNRKINTIEI